MRIRFQRPSYLIVGGPQIYQILFTSTLEYISYSAVSFKFNHPQYFLLSLSLLLLTRNDINGANVSEFDGGNKSLGGRLRMRKKRMWIVEQMSVQNDFCVCNHLLLHSPYLTSCPLLIIMCLRNSCYAPLTRWDCWLATDRKMDTKLVEETIFIFVYLENNSLSSSSSFTERFFIFTVCW